MIFNYFRYIQPTWYFNLKPSKDFRYFSTPEQIEQIQTDLVIDDAFLSVEGKKRDLAYRAFQKGLITKEKSPNLGLDIWSKVDIPAQDEYRFLRKNFSPIWVVYTLILRIITFHNPLKEIIGFLKSSNAKRQQYHQTPIQYPDYNTFNSQLIEQNPLVSVIIPTLNRYKYLKDVFRDLEKQDYKNFEVIVVDQTDPFDKTVYEGWNLDLHFWYQEEKALWKARNEAIKSANGDLILLYDDDSQVNKNWISEHLKALDYFNADLSSGVSISVAGAKVPPHYSYFRWSDQLDTGNALIKWHVFEEIGLFDRQFEKQRMGDGEYGLRAYLAGFRNISNPKAKRVHLKVGQGGLRQMGSWDAFRPKSFWAPRPIPSVLYLFRKYHGNKAAVWALVKNIPPSIVPYAFKKNKLLIVLGTFTSLLLFPILLWQVHKSWNKSSKKLHSPNIEQF